MRTLGRSYRSRRIHVRRGRTAAGTALPDPLKTQKSFNPPPLGNRWVALLSAPLAKSRAQSMGWMPRRKPGDSNARETEETTMLKSRRAVLAGAMIAATIALAG